MDEKNSSTVSVEELFQSLIEERLSLIEYAASHSLEDLLTQALDKVERLTGSCIGFYHFVEADQKTLSLQQWSTRTLKEFCKAEGKGLHYDIDKAGVWVDCLHQKKAVIHNDYASLPHKKRMPADHAAVIRELVAPVIRKGKVVAILGVGNKVTDYTERDLQTVVFFADVTWEIVQTKKAEEASNKSALEWSAAMDASDDAIYLLDPMRHILQANKAFYLMTGSSPHTALGQHIESIVHPEGEVVRCPVCLAQEEKRDAIIIMESDHPDNPIGRAIEITVKVIREGKGQPVSLFMRLHDLTEQRKFEEKLKNSSKQWRSTFDAMTDIVTMQDKNMRIVRANKAAHQFLQVKFGELNGRHCYEVFIGSSSPCPGCPLLETLQDMNPHSTIITHEKLGRIFQVSSAIISAENKDDLHLVHIARDITDQKKLEEDLRQSQKMEAVGILAGGIAHDFNNILSAILGFSSLAKRNLPPGSTASDDIEQIITSGKRAAALVQQILDLSRKTKQTLQAVEPHLIVQEVMQMLRSTLPSSIEMEIDIDPDCGTIMADSTRMHQVVLNLCTNAFHAMQNEKGTLRVTLSREQRRAKDGAENSGAPVPFIVLSVSDTGYGMSPETAAHIFDPYFTTKIRGDGTGLGLALVHGIVDQCRGFIEVESEPGKGSTFRVFIPSLQKDSVSLKKQKTQDFMLSGTERILVVDDEPLLVRINTRYLEGYGYDVTGVTDSREALEKVRAEPKRFDLIVTDQTMPGLTGSELAKAVLEVAPDMPIILCTGHSSVTSAEDASGMGIKRYVYKPVEGDALIRAVRTVLDER